MPKEPPKPVDEGPFEYALSPEGREAQLTDLAYKCIVQRLRDNTASPNETVACLRLGTERAKLESIKLIFACGSFTYGFWISETNWISSIRI